MKKKTILIYTGSGGFLSIAQAVEQALKKKYNVVEYKEEDISLYLLFYRFFPATFKIPYLITQNNQFAQVLSSVFKLRYEKKQLKPFQKFQPDLVINTYFMCIPFLSRVCEASNHQFI